MASETADFPLATRAAFLDYLREKCAYDGGDTIEDVQKFLKDRDESGSPIELVGEDDKPIDLAKVWAKTANKPQIVKFNASAGESDAEKASRLRGDKYKRTAGSTSGISRAAANDAGNAEVGSGYRFGDRLSALKKAYDYRAKRNATMYPDADMAEACTAWIRSTSNLNSKDTYSRMDEDLAIVQKSASATNMTTGGALVPEEFRAHLIYLSEKYGVARRVTNVVPMGSDTAKYPRLLGEFTFSFSGESVAATDGTLPTDRVELSAKKAIGLAKLPNELMDDAAISVSDMYARGFAKGIAKLEDQCYFLGDGTTTYGGIVGLANALPSTAFFDATGTAWTSHVQADIDGLIATVENDDLSDACFVCSRQYYITVMKPMIAATGRGSMNEFLTVNGLGGPADAQWCGWPVYFSQVLPTVTATTSKCVYFGNFRAASMLGDRKQLMIATSSDRYFDTDEIGLRAIQRFAINIHGDGRGSTYGPIVGIKTS